MSDSSALDAIRAQVSAVQPKDGERYVGMLSIKTANQTVIDAARRPNPVDLYNSLWYEGEVCCLFADSNIGKSIFAVQMADYVAHSQPVLYVDCELSDKQFQLRYTDQDTGLRHIFPDNLLRAEIRPEAINAQNYEDDIIQNIEEAAISTGCRVIVIDNLTYLCNSSEKGDVAGIFMMKLMTIKKKHGWSLLIIAHTPKRTLSNPITQNDLAGSKKLYNFFDSVIAIGQSANDPGIKYVKQVKVRAGEYKYGSDNVIVHEIVSEGGFVHFSARGFAKEKEHLKEMEDSEVSQEKMNVAELVEAGKSIREIAAELGISKSKAGRIVFQLKNDTKQEEE
jgi:predicted ATP-dependent serine protease